MSLTLASPFQDNAVLQRDQMLPVWGWTSPVTIVRATLAGNVACAVSNAIGEFILRLPALPAGGPHTLSVTVPETGEEVEAGNILIGEVWLASGQSNMGMTMQSCAPLTDDDIASANFPNIRFFNVPRRADLGPHSTVDAIWEAATPKSTPVFSAVAFAFARHLHRKLGVAIGVLSSSWGGTFIQAWLSRSALALHPPMQKWLSIYEGATWGEARWAEMRRIGQEGRVSNLPQDPGNTGVEKGYALPLFDDSTWSSMPLPGTWQYNGHQYSGAFWFRRVVEIPESWIGRELELQIGMVDKHDVTYVNGVEVGRMGKDREDQYWNIQRVYKVPASLVTGKTLQLAVRAFSFVFDGGLRGPAANMKLHPVDDATQSVSLAGDWKYICEHNLGPVRETHIMGHGVPNTPHILFDNMIRPLVPYALKGAIWYQGESNSADHELYAGLLRELILDWRRQWGLPDMGFYTVQLPGYMDPHEHQWDSRWARLREAQLASLSLPNTGIAVTTDVGDKADIHPKDKMPIGARLAESALLTTYGDAVAGQCPPVAESFTVEGGAIRCRFTHASGGMGTSDGQPPLRFFVAGEDRIFHPAIALIEQDTVLAHSTEVPNPVAVRYAWADNPEGCNLSNRAGLPASPFRSDNWETRKV
ncbi:MAG: sialate O-acetylesterase [Candidatus Methylacidiphilales bacterium]|nr:sialate O-acetylesterase [Candidatus Methylacidiphilales bacterium]